MKKQIISVTLILLLVLSSTAMAFADGQTRDTNLVRFVTQRTSRTTAEATVNVQFSNYTDQYSVALYLQRKIDGQWVSDTTNPEYMYYYSGQTALNFSFSHIYSALESGEIYRLKCISRDTIGSNTYTTTTYSNQF